MKLGIIGAGNMGRAIAKGVAAANPDKKLKIYVYDRSAEALAGFEAGLKKDFGSGKAGRFGDFIKKADSGAGLAEVCDIVLLAVKPQQAPEVFKEIAPVTGPGKIVVSIMAGVELRGLKAGLPLAKKFVRTMPNLAAKVGKSVSAVCFDDLAADERKYIADLLRCIGVTVEVNESLFHAVTAVSGSGPAYFYMFIEALAKAGAKRGMTQSQARVLAAQTALGAAATVLAEDTGLEDMRLAVCSKGGTTIEAVDVLQKANIYDIIDKAVDAAYNKSRELAKADK